MSRYTPAAIEPKWQAHWDAEQTFKTTDDRSKPKFYCLDMFPYPSGAGLHVGHPEGYTATDILCRYKRAKGFNVLHPMGWDAFGLPAEQYALQTGTHPAITTQTNCDNFRRQIKQLGLSYDWNREINTTDPKYFKWTQWIFIKLYDTWFDESAGKGRPIGELPIPADISAQGEAAVQTYRDSKRLAYYGESNVWFCPHCKTVCANEEVLGDGTHEKCGKKGVYKKPLKQWSMRIATYGQRLLDGLNDVDWPEGIKEMQRNWIGKSTGAEVDFAVQGSDAKLRVYTTRPDTLFGATYMVIAPEHPLRDALTTADQKSTVEAYVAAAALKSDLERTELAKDKSGVFSGSYGINPLTGQPIPIWIADYVLMGYGTGAIMAVPAHDTRDFEFAQKFELPVVCIQEPDASCAPELKEKVLAGLACWTEDGAYIRSANTELDLNGLSKAEGIEKTIAWLMSKGLGLATTNFKLRDWLFSRQRYWGEPFPILHWEDGSVTTVPENELPLQLPEVENFHPSEDGESPLANAGEWLTYTCPTTGRKARRETNTMPQWAGSCWYYLRYIDPLNEESIFDAAKENYWMPVDLYVGGAEHAVLHLLYSRFWHKVLFDLGVVSTSEPFQKLFNQGMILAFAYETSNGSKVPSDEVDERDGKYFDKNTGEEVFQIVAKMSKSLKNVVNPEEVVQQYGADSLRLYEMFMGPLEATKPWQTSGVEGVYRFLARVWRLMVDEESGELKVVDAPANKDTLRVLHKTIAKVSSDVEGLAFNTAISAMMELNNYLLKLDVLPREVALPFVQILAPFAPHLAEELWSKLGQSNLSYSAWPIANTALMESDEVEVVFNVNGKVRSKATVSKTISKDDLEALAKADPKVISWTEGKEVVKIIVVPGKMVNIVVKG